MPRRTTRGSACQSQPYLQSATWNPIGFGTPSRMRGGGTGPGGASPRTSEKPWRMPMNVMHGHAADSEALQGTGRYRFVAPVMIDVYAEGPIDQEEMAWFLSQKCFVSMDGLGTGVGPGESVVLPVVDWEALRMMKGGSGRKPI